MKRNLSQEGIASEKDTDQIRRNLFQADAAYEKKKAERRSLFRLWHLAFIMMGTGIFLFRYYVEISPQKVEYGYSRAMYPYIAAALSFPFRMIPAPYSASELFFGSAFFGTVIWFCYNLYLSVHKKKSLANLLLKTAIHAIVIVAGGYFFYLTMWGFNYLREPFSVSLNQESPTLMRMSDYENMADNMLFLTRFLRESDCHSSDTDNLQETDAAVDRAVRKVVHTVFSFRLWTFPSTKILFSNEFLNAFGISGFFSPFSMEPHINSDLSAWERPFVMAHEKAHFVGFASETDANFIAYIACLTSGSEMLRYSGALNILLSLRPYISEEKWGQIREQLPDGTLHDIRTRNERIRRNRIQYSLMFRVGQKVNDTYLKLNSQELGIKSYQAALPHLVVWWKKRGMILF